MLLLRFIKTFFIWKMYIKTKERVLQTTNRLRLTNNDKLFTSMVMSDSLRVQFNVDEGTYCTFLCV